MTIQEALIKYRDLEIELLLAHVLKKPKEFLFMHPEYRLTAYQLKSLIAMAKRRNKGEPVAYILGYKDFYGLRFKVNRHVLVPRPETEMVVDLLKANITPQPPLTVRGGQGGDIKILDIGTGSGCIIVSIAKQLRITDCELYGSDISEKALKVAKQNAKFHHTKVKFIKSDLLKNIKFNPDIIIANLPYGWKEWKNNTSAATVGLKFEPQHALFTKENGLYLIRQLLDQVAQREAKPQAIYLEFDPRQKNELQKLIKKVLPGSKFEFYKDFRNLWRYVKILPKEA